MRCKSLIFLATLVAMSSSSYVSAQEVTKKGSGTNSSSKDTASKTKEELIEEKNKESKDGTEEFHRTFGFGVELGYWFSTLDALGTYVFDNNRKGGELSLHQNFRRSGESSGKELGSQISGNLTLDLALEAQLLKGVRVGIFGGLQSPVISYPSSWAFYGGIEPAFAFRRDKWEFALGMGVGFGGVFMKMQEAYKNKLDGGDDFSANFVMLRPFFEGRYYFNHWFALYGRIGFNQWLVQSIGGELQPREALGGRKIGDNKSKLDNLNEGQLYLSVGVRFGWYGTPVITVGDRDGDGYIDDVDQCPDDPENFNGFEDEDGCPEFDRDKDGIFDKLDKCPDDPEDFDGFEDEDGCPDPDNDKDGILDIVDECPNDPEDFDGLGDEDGCPEDDFDGDTVLDVDDKCPKIPGLPSLQGCLPENTQVTQDQIIITTPVEFDLVNFGFDRAVIDPSSYPILDGVVSILAEMPWIIQVEVAGHTDHHGTAKYNLNLSQKRADAVKEYLISKNISPERLTAVGYGFSNPIIPLPENGVETEEGAAKNRRVEFRILKRAEVPAAANESSKGAPKEDLSKESSKEEAPKE